MSGRLLGIDLGERRVGLAIAETDGLQAHPLATIRRARDIAADAAAVARVAREQGAVALVVGLPLDANGDTGPMAIQARAWGEAIGIALALPVSFRDERLSSHLAEERIGPIGRGRSGGPPSPARREAYRARVDREAAAIILQDELEARRAAAAAGEPHP